ncbi:MAG: lipoyl(octanoyl) transferase LipB [Rhodocyclaceae bacterium]|nr:lipoyl(octanoyl) transferase LipB [Rhodocyclaceae bacterium]MBX3666820.1 lipoyl(octanoyl) transferase LipB [Rhodocyclaceae bacterium]
MATRKLGLVDYEPTWRAMQRFTDARDAGTADELWLLEHPPVFTLGLAGRREHLLEDIGVPVIHIDRGGQVTYHGPGQVVAYLLIDLRRKPYKVRELVHTLEQTVIDLAAAYGIAARRKAGAPGVYVDEARGEAKFASLGLRVKNGCTYHGLALNINMDLHPFSAINPCGYTGLFVTQLKDLGVLDPPPVVADKLAQKLTAALE